MDNGIMIFQPAGVNDAGVGIPQDVAGSCFVLPYHSRNFATVAFQEFHQRCSDSASITRLGDSSHAST